VFLRADPVAVFLPGIRDSLAISEDAMSTQPSTPLRTPGEWDAESYARQHGYVWQAGAGVVELLNPQPGERIVDLGCGPGQLTSQIAMAGATVLGLDQSPEMIAQARAAFPALAWEVADARSFRVPEPVDAVFSNAVLHWVREPQPVLNCVATALKPGGRFVAEFGGHGNVAQLIAGLQAAAAGIGRTWQPPWYYPSLGEYLPLVESAGLEVTFAQLFDRPTPLPGPDGLRAWVEMFVRDLWRALDTDSQKAFLADLTQRLEPLLFRAGTWFADYRRLRLLAWKRG